MLQAPYDKEIVSAGGYIDELEVSSINLNTNLEGLQSNHEEADTRLVLHAVNSHADEVVIWCKDTDVLLLLVAHFHRALLSELMATNRYFQETTVHIYWQSMSVSTCNRIIGSIVSIPRHHWMRHIVIYRWPFKAKYMESF